MLFHVGLDLSPALPPPLPPRPQFSSHRPLSMFSSSKTSLSCAIHSLRLRTLTFSPSISSAATVEPLQHPEKLDNGERDMGVEEGDNEETEMYRFKAESLLDIYAEKDARHLPSPEVEVIQLEDLPDQWKRSRIAWLCKELPAHKQGTLVRILNAQRKWIRQEDATYVTVHCMRIRENEAAYRVSTMVYSWMSKQHWFHFDFALATKLADYLGRDRKFAKCREIFDAVIKQGRVPAESTFHILTVAYLSAPFEGCIEEASSIYNRMIHLGGYRPRLSLHNSLFRALLGQLRRASQSYLKQAEFIYHNLVTSDLEVQKEIYAGLIWLHSYQEHIDRERIDALRDEMSSAGYEEDKDLLISMLRACSKQGDVEEAEKIWLKLLSYECALPSQAFVYKMELYSKAGDPMKSLEIFKDMKNRATPVAVNAYHKIIQIMTNANEIDIAETLVDKFTESRLKPLNPAFHDLMSMYLKLGMHDKLDISFSKCLSRCHPNRNIYGLYLESLVMVNNLEKAEQIFNEMQMNGTIGANARSCNIILRGYLAADDYEKGVKVYDMMRQKNYDVEPGSIEQMEQFFHHNKKLVRKSVSLKLGEEQREILIGLLLGGADIVLDEHKRKHAILFKCNARSEVHSTLRTHIHERFYEWLTPNRSVDGENEIPFQFSTIPHSSFSFFAAQFWSKDRPVIPKLIHRWLSARVLAYWYMYGGFKSSSEDILLKLRGATREDIEKVLKDFQGKDIAGKVKRKGRFFWIGFQGSDAVCFWRLVEPFLLPNVKELLMPNNDAMECDDGHVPNQGSVSDVHECGESLR
ncbi:pentatricopeptide repeat-containing protein OTP51, chloroplastic isoform X2 [Phalaenopsis equestris]|uniref:pentatricopeptide repeat-containing protein OTP51, chloroplastic isoform X2 n=1 Tax=Phalaenopsis equestris TaxID=78828 RepID=UPI0009E22F3B|nr:pentatricopeptide repeat-containing protein OTP51, chloroplastic isoform X2 [Phalaenopsis equestris]